MIYKPYGKTGKQVSAVGFGGMRFDTTKSLEENAELLRYACSLGINYFDTAPGYCEDKSELIFGEAFKNMPGPYYVSTKGMPVNFDTADKAREAVHRSLERLGVPKINFYHVWCIRKMEHYDLAMQPGGQYDGLLQCQQEGLIDHIVFSSHQPGAEIKQILDEGKMDGVLLGMNILNFPYRWDGVQAAYESGYGVVAMNPLSGGMIPQNEDKLAFLARPGETPTEAALRFIISCPQISVALNGFTTREQIATACRIADHSAPFTAEDLAELRQHLSANLDAVCTGCGYCHNCPQQIPVPSYMQFYNQKQMFATPDEEMPNHLKGAQDWGILVGRKAEAGACIACGNCEDACTQHLNIVERLREIAAWETKLAN
ncbi:MAG TPA: aldo/keto reductase [Armatimonadota bacterium]|jgi:hypothetical protein